ncbi:MAG: putative serine protease HhoB precursor [Planctomycetota bacterium]
MRPLPTRNVRWHGILAAVMLVSVSLNLGSSSYASSRRTPIVEAVNDAMPSVVNIHGRKTVRSEDAAGTTGDHFRQVNGMGTGIVIDERGYVLTNHHVVDGVSRIQVTLHDQRTVVAKLIAHDQKSDLAVIKLDVEGALPLMRIGTSSDLMAGETVIAIGNAYGYEHTVTTGIISALHRTVQVSDEQTYRDVIQTSADINPGNSGGPLLNIDGELVGINVAVRIGAQGIAFAIPVDQALEIAAGLLNSEKVGRISHGIVGKTDVRESQPQFVVTSLRKESPAKATGLEKGDVVVAVDDLPIRRALDFERAMLRHSAGESVEIQIQRSGDLVKLQLPISGAARKGANTVSTSGGSNSNSSDRTWDVLGLRLEPVPGAMVQQIDARFNGGLKILEVRPGSPAASQRLRAGDILVGLQTWETVRLDNVTYILNRPEITTGQPIRFYILRGNETLFGSMRVNAEMTR